MAKNILTITQRKILRSVGNDAWLAKKFYLTGGTALAGYYIFHRFSEDLDFFSDSEIEPSAITVFFKKQKSSLKIKSIDFQQSYNRNLYFLQLKDEVVKIEFTYFPFSRLEQGRKENHIEIDSILDIAVNKLFTIYQRSKARDYIVLYCILKEKKWAIKELILKAKLKFDCHIDPIQLGTQFIKAENTEDLPKTIIRLPEKEWKIFFTNEAKTLREMIL